MEVDALRADLLKNICAECIIRHVPEELYIRTKEIEQTEADLFRSYAQQIIKLESDGD